MNHCRWNDTKNPGTDQPGPDDGQDPRFDRKENPRAVFNRKSLQLAKQVFRTLSHVFLELKDDQLRDLLVESVQPFPNSGRLLVTLVPPISLDLMGMDAINSRLLAIQPILRTEVAASITRRKVPDLIFRLCNRDSSRL